MKRNVLVILMIIPLALMAEIRYKIVNLGNGFATAINNSGQVAISTWSEDTATRYTDGLGLEDLGNPNPSDDIYAQGINDHGQIIAFNTTQSFRYSDGRGWEQIGPEEDFVQAWGINNRGQVAGMMENYQIFRYTDGIGIEIVGSGLGGAINDHGWVTGMSGGVFLYRDHFGLQILGPGWGMAINNRGAIAATGPYGPVMYYHDKIIPMVGGGIVLGMNDKNQTVGFIELDVGWASWRGYIWSEGEGTRDLNDLIDPASGWLLWEATGINNSGQICGNGIYNGQYLPFRLDPVKHPKQKVPPSVKKIPTPGKKAVSTH